MKNLLFGLAGLLLLTGSCAVHKKNTQTPAVASAKKDTVPVVKAYNKVITKNAVTKKGLIDVHQVDRKYYFEIPASLLQREILVVTRFIKTPAGGARYGGEMIGEKTIIWEKGPMDKIFLRVVTLLNRANEEEAISLAVKNSSITPILEAFDIKAVNEGDSSYVIEVTDFLNSENALLSLSKEQKDSYNLSSLEKDKSYIQAVNTYPINTEVKTVKTYKAKEAKASNSVPALRLAGVVTLEINNSFILLPETPMKQRFFDDRVGYFASSYMEYGDDQQRVTRNAFIHRWRLEPKPEDVEKWKNGELVEPRKPILFYIDPATPEKWRPYLIQGINDWQTAFEQAGFRNAIIGKEWPEDADSMSLEDARFSVVRYFASPIENAYGPNVTDPRSGEIIESHIGWYHNIMNLVHNWYMIQAGAIDPRARKMTFDDELMGALIRYVISHEVGHTLGLRHNKGASYATPVEKLRDSAWIEKYGHTSSIMDYARFNYVAQPEDNISPATMIPKISDYDKWAIRWGYTLLPGNKTAKEEKDILAKWIDDSVSTNARLWFGGEGKDFDPRSQSEDLGNNAMIASAYGIKNLQFIVPKLLSWTREHENDNYEKLKNVYEDVLVQYNRYLGHVIKYIGGIYITPQTVRHGKDVYDAVPKTKQKEALKFLDTYVFHELPGLFNNEILNKIESPHTKKSLVKSMEDIMGTLLNGSRISRLGFVADRYNTEKYYKPEEYVDDLSRLVWKELDAHQPVNSYRRTLQKAYLLGLVNLYNPRNAKGGFMAVIAAKLAEGYTYNTDVRAIALHNMLTLQKKLHASLPLVKDTMTKIHYQYVLQLLKDELQKK